MSIPTEPARGAEALLTDEWRQILDKTHVSQREEKARELAALEWDRPGLVNKAAFTSRETYLYGRAAELLNQFQVYNGTSAKISSFTVNDFKQS